MLQIYSQIHRHMEQIKTKIQQSTLLRYIITGGGSFAFELTVLFLLKLAGLSNTWAVALSYWVGLTVSFLLQKFITFEDKDKSVKRVGRQVVMYLALVALNYGFAITFTSWLATHINFYIARCIALFITTFFNFLCLQVTHFWHQETRRRPGPA